MNLNEAECVAAGLDLQKVELIARGLERYAKQASALGLIIFGGSGNGTLRYDDGAGQRLIVAELSTVCFDGGDGATHEDSDGLMRGE